MEKLMNHPSRKELLEALGSSGGVINLHLSGCDWCGLYFELLKSFNFSGEIPLPSAPAAWIEKAINIPGAVLKPGKIKSLAAKMIFDSWDKPAVAGVRGETLTQERRVRFDISELSFDLRAEKRKNQWDFTARITDSSGRPVDCILKSGKSELKPDENGFYQWSSARPPRKLTLLSDRGEIEIPELSWKISQTE